MKKKVFVAISILILIVFFPIICNFLADILSPRYPNKSQILKTVAFYSSFGLISEVPKMENYNVEENNLEENNSEIIYVDTNAISVQSKRIIRLKNSDGTFGYSFSAMLINNSERGIPQVKIEKITIYDKANKIIGEVTDYPYSPSIVEDGEVPFSYYIGITKKDFIPTSFDLKIAIEPFEINNSLSRLEIAKVKLIKKEFDLDGSGYEKGDESEKSYSIPLSYTYRVTIKNTTSNKIEDIYYTAFLKHKNIPLTRLGSACCYNITFEPIMGISLNETENVNFVLPGESKTIDILLAPEPLLYSSGLVEKNIKPTFYFIGSLNLE